MVALIDLFNSMGNNLIEVLEAFVETIDFIIVSEDVEVDR